MKGRRLRIKKSVEECCLLSGISIPTWYKYEDGKIWPSLSRLDDIADALGVIPKYLVDKDNYDKNLLLVQKGE
jgi:transcriptional regulator with XRE-family HTH domain